MNIPTANIVVAFNKEVMERLFSSGATYKSLVADLSEGVEDALLFDNVANPNFISLEHSLGLGGGMKIVLSFIDPKNEFEKRFFTNNPAEIIESFSNPSNEKSEGFITDKPDDVRQSQEKYSKRYVAQYKKELDKNLGNREFYIAYGTGNNLNLWSGPHRTVMTSAEITVDGAKKITLTLTPTPNSLNLNTRRGAYNERVNLNLLGLKMRYAGESQEIKFNSKKPYDPTEYISGAGENTAIDNQFKENREVLASLGFEELSKKLEKFDFHCMVVDAIRSYVQKATSNKNVIVLLPNLNITCRQAINDEAKKFQVIDPSGTVSARFQSAATEVKKIPLFGSFLSSRAKDLVTKAESAAGRTEMFVESTLRSFGLRMHMGDREDAERLQKQALPTGIVAKYAENEKYPKLSDAIEEYYDNRYFTAVIDKTDRELPDHMAVLGRIFDRIKKLSHESYKMSSLAVLNETEINMMKLWTKSPFKKFYTFGGYDELEGDSAIIVGDLALIKEYLYGSANLQQKKASIDELKRKAKSAPIRQALKRESDTKSDKKSDKKVEKKEEPTKEDYLFAAATQVPLHPLDYFALNNVTYNKEVREIAHPVLKGSGAFGDISYLPDDFAYQDASFSDKEKEYIEKNGIPVFRYNTQNPNTLDMKFKFGAIYFAQLKAGYQKEISKLTSAVAEGVLPTGIGTFPIRERGAAIAYLRSKGYSQGLGDKEKKEIINQLALRVSPDLAEDLDVDSTEAAADSMAVILEGLEEKNLHGLVLVDQQLPGNPQTILSDFTEEMYRKGLQMSITTLPLFHISKTSSLGTPCIFFGQDQPITQSIRPSSTAYNKFFSGLYKIMGFKHTITTGAATSEFNLVKNAPKFRL